MRSIVLSSFREVDGGLAVVAIHFQVLTEGAILVIISNITILFSWIRGEILPSLLFWTPWSTFYLLGKMPSLHMMVSRCTNKQPKEP